MLQKYILTAVSMVLLLLGVNLSSSGYDFIGKPNHRYSDEPPVGEREVKEEPKVEVKEEPKVEEDELKEKITVTPPSPEKQDTVKKPTDSQGKKVAKGSVAKEEPANALPEPQIKVEKPVTYVELDYTDLDKNNPKESLPTSESGNYIIVYRSDSCTYCDKLLSEIKDKTEAYIIVVVRCTNYSSRDLFYRRTIYSFPSWVIITHNRVTYYGIGYYPWESFKRILQ